MSESTKRPNVLVIMTDQHRADHLGFGGDPTVQTPNLDALAARSVRFDSAYVANPVCMPNRAAIMTGRMPSASGSISNGVPLDPFAATYVRSLRSAGYRTGLVGKSHLQNNGVEFIPAFPAPDPLPPPSAIDLEPGWDEHEFDHRYSSEDVVIPPDFYGFDLVELAIGHGDQVSGHYRRWLIDQGVDWASHWPAAMEWFRPGATTSYATSLPEELYPTEYVTKRGEAFVAEAVNDDRPWMLQLSYPDPHHPFVPPGRFATMYDPADVVVPSTFDDPHENSSPLVKRAVANRGVDSGSPRFWAPTEEQFRIMAALQYGMISMIDEGVGRVIRSLEDSGQLDNTIIIFTSDHGDMMGDHGLILKMEPHYRAITRVPLLVSGPGITPGVSDSFVQSIDIGQTVIDLCDTKRWAGCHGMSLRAVLDDTSTVVRNHILVEDDRPFQDPLGTGFGVRKRTLITEEFRLTTNARMPFGEFFLFDGDPDELENRFEDSEAASARADAFEQLADAQTVASDPGRTPLQLA